MKYTYESQCKALDYLVKNFPHDMDKFKKLYDTEIEGKLKANISIRDILFSSVWNAEEKEQLIKLYGHDKDKSFTYKTYDRDIGYSVGIEGLPLIDECIRQKSFSGVQALLSLGAHISVATITRIVEYIEDPSERYKFCELLVNHYGTQTNIPVYRGNGNQCYLTEIPTLCDRYPVYSQYLSRRTELWRTFSSMESICATNDLDLIRLFLPTVKNINPLLMFAVQSKNPEMVKLFIEYGADVNFQDLEFSHDNGRTLFKTPLKIAIDNNDLEMVKLLHQNGANLDFVDQSERMQSFIDTLGKDETEKSTHQYNDNSDRHAYISWTKTPLEYAINLGPTSIISPDLRYSIGTVSYDDLEKQFKERADVVRYLYSHGATFGNKQVNYTDLICFSIKSDDFESTKYYFEEALKHNAQLDFTKIISFIHIPGSVKKDRLSIITYKYFPEGANPWFRFCEEYSKKLDEENYHRNIRLMLEKIFAEFSFNSLQYDTYRDVIKDFSEILPKEILKEIPAIFGVSITNLEEVLNLGYDINAINEKGYNIIMHYILTRKPNIETLEKLISLGADVNYHNGHNALSCAINRLPQYDFGKFIRNFNSETGKLYYEPTEYEKEDKALVTKLIDLLDEKNIMSDSVQQLVCCRIQPGYPQIIYNEILAALSKKGFRVPDDYFAKSITFLSQEYAEEYVTDPWGYLTNLYNNFDNKSIGTNFPFPKIEGAKHYEYGTKESDRLFSLINTHLNRNFVTSAEQLPNPNQPEGEYYNTATDRYEELTSLQVEQNILLTEIARYIGNLDYRQIMALIDSFPIIDNASIVRNCILPAAMNAADIDLCRELVKRGISIASYDDGGHDITPKLYSEKQIAIFQSLNSEYNPNQECEDLLAQIGCGPKVYSKQNPQ